jgi:hypothetical protein
MTTSSRMLIERMLHNSASVMLRQKTDNNARTTRSSPTRRSTGWPAG